ncbi:MAG: hypothetical protein SGI94_20940 [Saprospiraceae bacterium]|nr:hypothetical protein [Saprospiraceae bacterium]
MSNYTFLPWLRRGAIRLANAPAAKERLTVPLHLKVIGEDESPEIIDRKANLYGPGDVTGIDWRAIVRTVPRANVRDFEANFLAFIEFYDEDFPWRYTPALPEAGKLKPWIWLTVLEENEYRRINSISGQLPVIEILPDAIRDAFPNADTTPSWAHVHLNFKPLGANLQGLLDHVQQQLDEDPNLGCTRLLCPRRLKAQTRYRAFLLPAFEKGRLAGLGRPEADIAATPNANASWPNIQPGQSVNAIQFPVYFEWEFATSSDGDFEDLSRKLSPITAEELAALADAAQLLDVSDPGWGVKVVNGILRMESALKLPIPLPAIQGQKAHKKKLREKLAPLLNLGVQPLDNVTAKNNQHPYFQDDDNPAVNATLDDDPIVAPPLYGSFYRPGETMQLEKEQDWFQQLNLNPVYRVAASQGTSVVQKNQEEYMDRAWDQWSVYAEIQKISRRWEFSLQVSQTLFVKRFDPMLSNNTPSETSYRAVGFFAPMHSSISLRGENNQVNSMVSNLRATRWSSTHAPSFNKLTRTGGPLMRRFEEKPQGNLFFTTAVIFAAIPSNPLKRAVDTVVAHLLKNSNLGAYLQSKGFGDVASCKTAFSAWQPYLAPRFTPPPPTPNIQSLIAAIRVEVQPMTAIENRFITLIETTYPFLANPAAPPQDAPVFPEAMYKELADRSSDFILPGLDRIAPNRVAILEPNQSFIEGYLTGLNHEMAREFLWREFPAPLNATYFRQFWDVRNAPAGARDILPIRSWAKNTDLGTHRPPPPLNPLVVVVRGDLLRKYPNVEIFMVQAGWKNKQAGSHKLLLDPADPTSWNNSSDKVLRPLFSASIAPDYQFLGFALTPQQARGNTNDAGWFVVFKERAGEVHFGLDMTTETPGDPSWEALEEIAANQCIDTASAKFANLPRAGKRADQLAGMLYQKPFMLFIHASQLLPEA